LTGKETSLGLTGKETSLGLTGKESPLGLTGKETPLGLTGKETSLGLTDKATPLDLTGDAKEHSLRSDSNVKWVGYNTDVYGFRQSIKPFLASHHERALILGTGGASKAVEHVLREIGVECVFVARSSTFDNATSVSGTNRTVLKYSDLNEHVMAMCKLIVNCTPVGTFPNENEAPAIPYEFLTPDHFLYDLVYNPAETEFIKHGKLKGAMVMNGLDMLKMQAEEAWKIWNRQ
jgi:shikimate dehydrogenase